MLLVVNFHYIRNDFRCPYPAIFGKTPQEFRSQLEILAKFGAFVSSGQVVSAIEEKITLPEKAILITFDDGLREQYELARPVLESMGIPAVYFINTKILEEPRLLNVHLIHYVRSRLSPSLILDHFTGIRFYNAIPTEKRNEYKKLGTHHYMYDEEDNAFLKYLLNFVFPENLVKEEFGNLLEEYSGVKEEELHKMLYMDADMIRILGTDNLIGSHSHDHLPLGKLPEEAARYQVCRSVKILEHLGIRTRFFSYPYGSNEAVGKVPEWLGEYGFSFALTMTRGVNDSLMNPYKLKRYDNNDVPGGKAYKAENPIAHFEV